MKLTLLFSVALAITDGLSLEVREVERRQTEPQDLKECLDHTQQLQHDLTFVIKINEKLGDAIRDLNRKISEEENRFFTASFFCGLLFGFLATLILLIAVGTYLGPKDLEREKVIYGKCTVCMENDLEVLLEPCHHVCVCRRCCVRVRTCPMCVRKIGHRKRVFVSTFV